MTTINKIIIFAASIFVASCSSSPENSAEVNTETTSTEDVVVLNEEQWQKANVKFEAPQLSNSGRIIVLNGKMESGFNQKASVCLPLGGYIVSSNVLPGQFVKKGSTLFIAENEQFIQLQQDYLTAKAELELNEKEFVRQSELNQANAVSNKNKEQAKMAFESSKIAVKSLAEKLAFIGIEANGLSESNISKSVAIKSPLNGYVNALNINPGRLMRPEDVVVEVSGRDNMHAVIQFFANDAQSIHENMEVQIYALNAPENKINVEVLSINNTLNAEGVGEIYCKANNYPESWVPGTYVKADVQTNNNSGIVIPQAAIVSWEGKDYIFEKMIGTDTEHSFKMTGSDSSSTR
ncbi:MAG: efflux RND transporter periplasmic adaptor subunit [Flavobacteriales bacterium]